MFNLCRVTFARLYDFKKSPNPQWTKDSPLTKHAIASSRYFIVSSVNQMNCSISLKALMAKLFHQDLEPRYLLQSHWWMRWDWWQIVEREGKKTKIKPYLKCSGLCGFILSFQFLSPLKYEDNGHNVRSSFFILTETDSSCIFERSTCSAYERTLATTCTKIGSL